MDLKFKIKPEKCKAVTIYKLSYNYFKLQCMRGNFVQVKILCSDGKLAQHVDGYLSKVDKTTFVTNIIRVFLFSADEIIN